MTNSTLKVQSVENYSLDDIEQRIEACPKLASLKSVQLALRELLSCEQSLSTKIAETIQRDPSLTARVLRMVNSVYFGLANPVNSIEDAVLYLGIRHIRDLSYATPVIEELERLHKNWANVNWTEMWKHSIGTAFMTREILATCNVRIDDDTDYIIGLLHNVGKVIIAHAFPKEFGIISSSRFNTTNDVLVLERQLIGMNHAELGALYLQKHQLSPEIVESVQYHHSPEFAPKHSMLSAAIQIADRMVCSTGIRGGLEQFTNQTHDRWETLTSWDILFTADSEEYKRAQLDLSHKLQRLPKLLEGIS
ncbi:MAG: HDOD domain-containing protein [Verrucomicrobiota bacterium]|nr:HDOD domain-containing protein [Verrucomicrobiota bacterium]